MFIENLCGDLFSTNHFAFRTRNTMAPMSVLDYLIYQTQHIPLDSLAETSNAKLLEMSFL